MMSFMDTFNQSLKKHSMGQDITRFLGIEQESKDSSNLLKKYAVNLVPCYFDISFYGIRGLLSNNLPITVAIWINRVYLLMLLIVVSLNLYSLGMNLQENPKQISAYKNLVFMPIINNPIYWLSYFVVDNAKFNLVFENSAYSLFLMGKEKVDAYFQKKEQNTSNTEVPTKV